MNVYKCWYRVIVCLLSRQIIIRQNATGNLPFSWRRNFLQRTSNFFLLMSGTSDYSEFTGSFTFQL